MSRGRRKAPRPPLRRGSARRVSAHCQTERWVARRQPSYHCKARTGANRCRRGWGAAAAATSIGLCVGHNATA
eukprot:6099718-Prymnesium_polylepis.2